MTIYIGTRDHIGEILADVVTDTATHKRLAPALGKLSSGKLDMLVMGKTSIIKLGGAHLALVVDDSQANPT
jgi:hypothetical protein